MKTDNILTFVTKSLIRQRGINIIMGALLIVCASEIRKLGTEIKALKESKPEGESE